MSRELPRAPDAPARSHPPAWLLVVVGAVTYFGAARLATLWTIDPDDAQPLWLAAGVALPIAVRAAGTWQRFGVAAAIVALGVLANDLVLGASVRAIGVDIVANVAEAIVALAFALVFLEYTPIVRRYSALTWVLLMFGAATVGAALAAAGHETADRADLFVRWLIGDALGLIIVAPVLLLDHAPATRKSRGTSWVEIAVTVVVLVAATVAAFASDSSLVYLVMPVLLWLCVIGGPRCGLPAALGLMVYASIATAEGAGPFVIADWDATLQVQGFNAAVAISALIVASHAVRTDAERRRSRLLSEAGPDPSFVADAHGALVPDQHSPVLDLPTGTSAFQLFAPEDHATVEAVHRAALAGSPLRSVVVTMVRPGPREVELRARSFGPNAVLYVARDVSQFLQLDAELRESQRRWRQMAETAYEAIVELDRTASIVYVSPRFVEMTGMEATDAVGRPAQELVGHEHWNELVSRWEEVGAGVSTVFETTYRTVDGSERSALVAMSPRTVDGEYDGALLFAADVTALRDAERERFAMLEELGAVERAERRRLAHDLHDGSIQELAAINLMVDRVRGALDGESAETLAAVVRIVSTTIDDLRNGLATLDPPEVDRGGLVAQLRTDADRLFRGTDTQISFEVDGPVPTGPTAVALYWIGREAITNAVRHADASSLVVALSTSSGWATLTVRDDGTGLDAAPAERLGHIGLRSMRARAREVGGTLRAENAPGGGTEVVARIPVEIPARPDAHDRPADQRVDATR